ncbi:DsrE family protein [Methanobacterium alkalithermotolerans]|uniref:DsrE family protein n=1 Tax=Methanobacterium alkalithermotolerans TaxID=2731220 RepID=A0A8T8K602_9EURY|nr:DsrE family protein [Methanobacterium alkalithermotolerans]QUH23349.1 DsrE family protein [Methanobacterium alkalithermotolerans]
MEESPPKMLTILLTEGPYRSQYADMAYEIAKSALNNNYRVNLFLYMDATHIPKKEQNPNSFPNVAHKFRILLEKGANIKACVRCSTARGHSCAQDPYIKGVEIKTVYELAAWIGKSDQVINLGG